MLFQLVLYALFIYAQCAAEKLARNKSGQGRVPIFPAVERARGGPKDNLSLQEFQIGIRSLIHPVAEKTASHSLKRRGARRGRGRRPFYFNAKA